MDNYKKEIYRLWSEKDAFNYPLPTDISAEERSENYKRFFIDKFFPKDKNIKILDMGCGWGLFLKSCKEVGYNNISGVEINERCVQFIKNKFVIPSVFQADAVSFLESCPDSSFDVITAIDVMEHFEKKEVFYVLNLIYKKLKKTGIFIMQVPNGGSLPGLYIFNSDLTHEIAFTDILIKEIFGLVGFEKTEISGKSEKKDITHFFINVLRKIFSVVISLNNEFVFTSNLIAVGYKKDE